MAAVSLRVRRLVPLASIITSYLLVSAGSSHAVSIGAVPQITVVASNAVQSVVHYALVGSAITMDAVVEADGAAPLAADVYVGILSPDGQSSSWVGAPQAPVLLNGKAVPFLKNVLPTGAASYRLVIPNFAAGGPHGWYVLYGLVVVAGSDPSDPTQWFSSSFFPLLVSAP